MSTSHRPDSSEPRFVLRQFVGHGRQARTSYTAALDVDALRARHCTVLYERTSNCPTCQQLLFQEPGACACRWGCGRIWRLVGVSVEVQREFERASGLAVGL